MSDYTDNSHRENDQGLAASESRPSLLSERVRSLRLPSESAQRRPSKNGLVFFLLVVCIALGGAACYLGYRLHEASTALDEAAKGPEKERDLAQGRPTGDTKASGIRLSETVASSGEVALERQGYIIPAHLILISPKVSGMIETLQIEEGKRVKKGEVLAEVEKTDYRADYDRSVAVASSAWNRFMEMYLGNRDQEIKAAKAELEEMEANKEQLYLDWKRNRGLTGSNSLAAREYEQAAGAYKAMERRVEKMKQNYQLMVEGPRQERVAATYADWEQAEADVAKNKWRLDNCTVRAPITGTILTKKAELGNLVNPIAMNGSFSLCEMANLAELEVELTIEEREVSKVFKGQKCRVRAIAYPDRTYEGVVSRLMPTADRAKSAIPVRVQLSVPAEEEGVYLKPEMGAIVWFLKNK